MPTPEAREERAQIRGQVRNGLVALIGYGITLVLLVYHSDQQHEISRLSRMGLETKFILLKSSVSGNLGRLDEIDKRLEAIERRLEEEEEE